MQAVKSKLRCLIRTNIGVCALLFFMTGGPHLLVAQQALLPIAGQSMPALRKTDLPLTLPAFSFRFIRPFNNSTQSDTPQIPDIPKAYVYQELGFFCKVEVQLEKRTRIPIKIRLGEVQYVERLEGKYP